MKTVFLTFGTTDTWGRWFFAELPSCDVNRCLQTLPCVPWGQNLPRGCRWPLGIVDSLWKQTGDSGSCLWGGWQRTTEEVTGGEAGSGTAEGWVWLVTLGQNCWWAAWRSDHREAWAGLRGWQLGNGRWQRVKNAHQAGDWESQSTTVRNLYVKKWRTLGVRLPKVWILTPF